MTYCCKQKLQLAFAGTLGALSGAFLKLTSVSILRLGLLMVAECDLSVVTNEVIRWGGCCREFEGSQSGEVG